MRPKDLYAVILEGLLELSYRPYDVPAWDLPTIRSPDTVPFLFLQTFLAVSPGKPIRARNSHLAWGLFEAILAFDNLPYKWEFGWEDQIDGVRVATGRVMMRGYQNPSNNTIVVKADANDIFDPFTFRAVFGRVSLLREAVYESVAYAILWIAQKKSEDVLFRTIQLSGPSNYLTFTFEIPADSGGHLPYKIAARVLKEAAIEMERRERFSEVVYLLFFPTGALAAKCRIERTLNRGSTDRIS